ncbi:MAG: hypothetical protein EAX96_17465 [Candidatus Lokiarchaeota archaeon]|nr:hypothetical protein [Candidatus Lokiarchaeota archaeon]
MSKKLDQTKLLAINDLFDIEIKNYNITLEEIMLLPVEAMKGISAMVAEELTEIFNIRTIGDLLTKEISKEQVRRSIKKGISIGDLKTWRMIANKIYSIDGLKLGQKERTIVLLGLKGAGKTTLVRLLKQDIGLDTILDVAPSEDIGQYEIQAKNANLTLWDVQSKFVEKFINKVSAVYFKSVELIFFVIDIQDSSNFEEVIQYFEKIMKMIKKLDESPDFFIIFNKADPEFVKTPTFQANYDNLKPRLKKLLEYNKISHEFFISSVYGLYGVEAASQVSKIAETVKKRKKITTKKDKEDSLEYKFNELYTVVDNLFDLVLKLTNSINSRLEKLEEKVSFIEFSNDEVSQVTDKKETYDERTLVNKAIEDAYQNRSSLGEIKLKGIKETLNENKKQSTKNELLTEMKKVLSLKKLDD